MVRLTAFEGADPTTGENRTMTIGRLDPDELAADVGRWAHDVTLRMLAGTADPDDDDEAPAPRPAVKPPFIEATLWSEA